MVIRIWNEGGDSELWDDMWKSWELRTGGYRDGLGRRNGRVGIRDEGLGKLVELSRSGGVPGLPGGRRKNGGLEIRDSRSLWVMII